MTMVHTVVDFGFLAFQTIKGRDGKVCQQAIHALQRSSHYSFPCSFCNKSHATVSNSEKGRDLCPCRPSRNVSAVSAYFSTPSPGSKNKNENTYVEASLLWNKCAWYQMTPRKSWAAFTCTGRWSNDGLRIWRQSTIRIRGYFCTVCTWKFCWWRWLKKIFFGILR